MQQKTPNLATRGGLAACQNSNPINDFIEAMRAAGVIPKDGFSIIADGVRHRFDVAGDKPGSQNGFYTLHLDGMPAGNFGCWKREINQNWSAKASHQLTPAERAARSAAIEQERQRRKRQEEAAHAEAARKAGAIWGRAQPADPRHPYLLRKSVTAGVARQKDGALVFPIVRFDGRMAGLQFIAADGSKRMLTGTAKKGNFIPCSVGATAARVIICEGWATGRTISEADPEAIVLAAIDCGNLEAVALGARTRWPGADLIIAGDDDRQTDGNPGRTKANAAALAAKAKLMIPEFPPDAPPELSDFNDLANYLRGVAAHG